MKPFGEIGSRSNQWDTPRGFASPVTYPKERGGVLGRTSMHSELKPLTCFFQEWAHQNWTVCHLTSLCAPGLQSRMASPAVSTTRWFHRRECTMCFSGTKLSHTLQWPWESCSWQETEVISLRAKVRRQQRLSRHPKQMSLQKSDSEQGTEEPMAQEQQHT